jgi:hypothetical protein
MVDYLRKFSSRTGAIEIALSVNGKHVCITANPCGQLATAREPAVFFSPEETAKIAFALLEAAAAAARNSKV